MIAATEAYMKLRLAVALVLGFGMTIVGAAVDPTTDAVNVHLAAAQRAAGLDFPGLLARVCIVPPGGGDAAAGRYPARELSSLARTVSPPTTLSPTPTCSIASSGRNTSMRDPNFMMPNRSPARTSAPACTRQTTRRARIPTICRATIVCPW